DGIGLHVFSNLITVLVPLLVVSAYKSRMKWLIGLLEASTSKFDYAWMISSFSVIVSLIDQLLIVIRERRKDLKALENFNENNEDEIIRFKLSNLKCIKYILYFYNVDKNWEEEVKENRKKELTSVLKNQQNNYDKCHRITIQENGAQSSSFNIEEGGANKNDNPSNNSEVSNLSKP
ncbi:10619_t:CDS:2, partial [Dentiscutata heterogama]